MWIQVTGSIDVGPRPKFGFLWAGPAIHFHVFLRHPVSVFSATAPAPEFIMSPPRILLCGDVFGRLNQLYKRVISVFLLLLLSSRSAWSVFVLSSILFANWSELTCATIGQQIGRSIRCASLCWPVFSGLNRPTRRLHGLYWRSISNPSFHVLHWRLWRRCS